MEITKCPICSTNFDDQETQLIEHTENDTYEVHCSRCGKFVISQLALDDTNIRNKLLENRAKLSGLSRYLTDQGNQIDTIKTTNIDTLVANELIPTGNDFGLGDKLNYILRFFRIRTKHIGMPVSINCFNDCSIAFAEDDLELLELLGLLKDKGYLRIQNETLNGDMDVVLTATALALFNHETNEEESPIGFNLD